MNKHQHFSDEIFGKTLIIFNNEIYLLFPSIYFILLYYIQYLPLVLYLKCIKLFSYKKLITRLCVSTYSEQ